MKIRGETNYTSFYFHLVLKGLNLLYQTVHVPLFETLKR